MVSASLVPYPDNLNLAKQAITVPNSEQPGWSATYKCAFFDHADIVNGRPQSLFQMYEESVARHPDRAMFLRRPVLPASAPIPVEAPIYGNTLIPTTYSAVQTRRNRIGSALLALEASGRIGDAKEITFTGLPSFGPNRAKAGARRGWGVGLWSKNREEWQVVDLACQAYGLVSVSLYETLGPDVAKYITNHCPLAVVFSASNHLPALLKIAKQCPTMKVIVCMDPMTRAERDVLSQWASSVNVELLDMQEMEQWGSQDGVRCDPGPVNTPGEQELDEGRIVTISYTSGTTGDPKGVVLTNRNIIRAVISNGMGTTPELINDQPWVFLSYLPLSHIYERFLQLLVMFGDGTIGLTTGDTTKLLEDAQLIKPDMMAGVPRVYNRIHAAVMTQMRAGGLKGALLTRAYETKMANWRATGQVTHAVYDRLVFKKIRNLLGGNLKVISSGAAPLSAEVHEMLKVCFSCDVIQGFGMTESIGTSTKGVPWDINAVGTCGAIQPVNELRLMDVPEMGYTSKDLPNPRGELCLRGDNVFAGYLHDPVNTKKTIDPDGWMHTGDVGEIDSAGRLKIVDRIKNVVKLSQGEYVALEKLEGMYALNPLFATLLVHADSTRSSLVAIGVLDPEQAAALVSSVLGKKLSAVDVALLEASVQDEKIRHAVLRGLAKTAKQYKLNSFENIKGVYLTLAPFSDDIMTPTLKVKRNQAAKKFAKEIDEAYRQAEVNDPAKL